MKAEDGPASRNELHESVVARTFDYDNEAKCEQHTGTFLRNIKAASEAPGQGFAAIKVNLLSHPTHTKLLCACKFIRFAGQFG